MNKGFVSLVVTAIITVVAAVAGGGVYGAYKYNEVVSENEQMKSELLEQKENEISALEQTLEETRRQAKLSNAPRSTTSSSSESVSESGNRQQQKEEPVKEVVHTVTEYVPVEVPKESTLSNEGNETKEVQKEASIQSEHENIKVLNVEEDLNEDDYSIYITWETSVNSDSRLILEGDQIFSSDNNDASKHAVEIAALEPSEKYDYEIIAEVGELKDSHFGKFQAPREFTVKFEQADDECTNVIVEDTAGYPLADTKLKLSGTYSGSSTNNWLGERIVELTNGRGEIEYCDPIERFLVENVETREVYYDTR